jgi:hypothetical protein
VTAESDRYEEVARFLLDQMAEKFGLDRVEGKQAVPGKSTAWEIDAKGVVAGSEGFVIVECRRYTNSRLNQEKLAGLAFKITDTGANGGITVSPLDLQEGAKRVAAHSNVVHVMLDPHSTTLSYIMRFLNQGFIGLYAQMPTPSASLTIQAIHATPATKKADPSV